MLETIQGNLYDYPKYYDLVYGSDWKAEFDFLEDCFERHGQGVVERLFEPACGTGRLLIKFATAGYQVGGLDLNPLAIDYCNDRLERAGYPRSTVVGDMTDFSIRRPADAAFNTINSFRHLGTETQARDHLQCVARSLRPGGLYVLGLHLTPTEVEPIQAESWSARAEIWLSCHECGSSTAICRSGAKPWASVLTSTRRRGNCESRTKLSSARILIGK